jgi:PPIC-type PPIASE domain/SurA-like N-terminal domain
MKYQLSACAVLLAALSPLASAQLASSHTPYNAFTEATAPMQAVGKPVARVNGTVLTDRDLRSTMYMMFPYARQHNGAVPKTMEKDIRAGAMKMMIFEELCYQEAQRLRMTVPPAKLHKAESDFSHQFQNPQQFEQYVQANYQGSRALMDKKIRRSLLIDAFEKAEINRKSDVSIAEARAFYEKHPENFKVKESFAIQTISVLPPANATPQQLQEARKRAEELLKKAKAAKTYEQFGLLAEKYSDDDYRVMMGDHKNMDRDTLPPQVVQAALALKPDECSDLIHLGNAFLIIKVSKHTPAGKQSFEAVQVQLRQEMQRQKVEQLRAALYKKLTEKAKIEVM